MNLMGQDIRSTDIGRKASPPTALGIEVLL